MLRTLRARWRIATGPLRARPDFLIVGAPKCGTTSLFKYMTQHPCVMAFPHHKEIQYFDFHADRSGAWYRSHFPLKLHMWIEESRRGAPTITGEASPTYLFEHEAPGRAHEMVPEARILVLLRNPVDRAYSHYHHSLQHENQTESFERAIERELNVLQSGVPDPRAFTYVRRGLYASQLKRWYRHFSPEQFQILGSEEFFRDPNAVLRGVFDWLGLPSTLSVDTGRRWMAGDYRDPVSLEMRDRLETFFQPHNEELYAVTGRRFDW